MFEKMIWLQRLVRWQEKYIDQRQLVLGLSLLTGIFSGLAAVALKDVVYFTKSFLLSRLQNDTASLVYFALPLVGIFITVWFVKHFVKENISHGITMILSSISRKGSILRLHNIFTSLIGSTFTVAFGGSVGLEAPIVLTGSSIGSNMGRALRLNYKTITLLIGCGAAGAIAGIFKAPIAAIVFCLEVLMLDLTLWSIVPLLISSVSATVVAYFLMGREVEFSFAIHNTFQMKNLVYYILLGIGSGLVSLYFTKASLVIEKKFREMQGIYGKVLLGGLILGVLIFILPPLFGEGYDVLQMLMTGNAKDLTQHSFFYPFRNNEMVLIAFFVCVMIFKVIAMSVTTGSGGVGGLFAPSLYTGGIFGFVLANLANATGLVNLPEMNFTLAGMAGVMAGVMHAPLTAIFLIAEITNGYDLFIPLILTASASYVTIRSFNKHSLYHIRLAQKGELITHHKDKAVLTLMRLESVIENDLEIVHPDARLGELVQIVSRSRRNLFPVVDERGMFMGIVLLNDIRDVMFNQALYDKITVLTVMTIPPAFVEPTDNMETVMDKFEKTEAWNLPVVSNGKYLGFISKSKIFSTYRTLLMDFSEE